jgi:predicted Zn finger-like uncharacterized protein
MALATRCPHCGTVFRVASDQLKLRAGLVRCGTCKEIFNGIENLQHPEPEAPLAIEPLVASLDGTPQPPEAPYLDVTPAVILQETSSEHAEDKTDSSDSNGVSPLKNNADTVTLDHDPEQNNENAENSPSEIAVVEEEQDDGEQSEVEKNVDAALVGENELITEPADVEGGSTEDTTINPGTVLTTSLENPTSASTASADDMPDFVRRGLDQTGRAKVTRVALRVALAIFLVCLAAQVLYTFRSTVAASFPQMRQSLESACQLLSCRVALPRQIDTISIESSDFQPITGNREQFALYVLLRSRSATVQAWPDIELTLTDTNDKPLASRVIVPKEYLPANRLEKDGFSAGAEQAIKLYLSLPQLKAAGYRVYLFYP